MPLRGSNHSDDCRDEAPYFKTLAELDEWAERPAKKLDAVLSYYPRKSVRGMPSENRGKLLVCHDYKGGYTEAPGALAYTFNFWSYCDTFIYFSHHRVTVPPSGWTTAAHRQGVRMLGTLIFEGVEGEQDCLRLLVGRLPQSSTGPAESTITSSLPLSPHYAQVLAQLAHQRGFDGYLLNFECPLRGGLEQTRALTAWIAILNEELRQRVGPHAQVIWYDSVLYTGQLRWQDRLNSFNLPFFIPSSGFFTNYTWPTHYPSLTAQYFLSLDSALVTTSKVLQDIFVGVDVWGRGSHGGGGFGCYKALSHIDPQSLGLSVALFGQAWTWESEQDKPGWSWDAWWEYERKLWLGPEKEGETVAVPPQPRREHEPECLHGPFMPLTSFFPRLPPPNPLDLPFFTSFSPGVGRAWFIGGKKVLQTTTGWTDLDKNCSLGDMLWPRPTPKWEHGRDEEPAPETRAMLSMDNAWLGGSSVEVSMSFPGSDAEDAFFQCVWLPVQSLAVSPRRGYDMTFTYKIDSDRPVDFDLGLSVKLLVPGLEDAVEVTPISAADADDLPEGWMRMVARFTPTCDGAIDVLAATGIIIGFAVEDPTQPITVKLILGALAISPSSISSQLVQPRPKVIWADFQSNQASSTFPGVLTLGTASSLAPLRGAVTTLPEDPRPVWQIDPVLPSLSYFNVYAQPHSPTGYVPPPEQATFIGTTGLDGRSNRFFVDPVVLPPSLDGTSKVRFYVQGVTDRGDVLDWASSAYVDVMFAAS